MDSTGILPLLIGDRVRYNGYEAGGSGEVMEHLSENYVRVQWEDLPVPTTHHRDSLRRDRTAWPWGP